MHSNPNGCFCDTIFDIISIGWSLYDFIKEPLWENFGWLALDVVFSAVPYITSGSIIKAASKLDDASDGRGFLK